MDERGSLLFEYWPLPFTPMTVAGLLLLAIVTVAAPFALPGELFGWPCFLPVLAAVLYAIFQMPNPTRIYAHGIELSLPVWRLMLGARRYIPWTQVRNVYPAAYEISGASMSPFASSAGTLVHTGLGLELADGRRRIAKFTPGSIRAFRGETEGFSYAMAAVREAFAATGRTLVTDVRSYSDAEIVAMSDEARVPLLGLPTIVFAFFIPPAIVAAVYFGLAGTSVLPGLSAVPLAVGLAAVPPLASMIYTYGRSRRRNWLLSELAKHEEALRARSG